MVGTEYTILNESERLLGRYVKVRLDIKKGWRMWVEDPSVSTENKANYRILNGRATEILADLQRK